MEIYTTRLKSLVEWKKNETLPYNFVRDYYYGTN